ncbi:ribosome-recycling factor protein [Artemisia annua]|uniref:Ribosome-recycling factor, chloroplastic n=1 Tax=Artemisia annua TaxID=35608 RepID=A0A2U1KKV2_ARTAN|nr:ribosome-recycling factor protein [Artemisia annua]
MEFFCELCEVESEKWCCGQRVVSVTKERPFVLVWVRGVKPFIVGVLGTQLLQNLKTSKMVFNWRDATIKCATMEEIEAEKSLIEKSVKERMEKAIDSVLSNFNSIRTGRSNPAMLDKVEVEYYGSPVGLKTIAQISTPDSSSLLVQPYDKSSLKSIEKAIVNSDLGMTPSNDGEVIRLSIPQLTSDRRKELSKIVAKQAEEGKVAIRNIRRDAIKSYDKLEKEKKLSEDNVKDLTADLQKLTDEYMKKIDTIFKQKEKELLTV